MNGSHASAELLAGLGELLAAVRATRVDFDVPGAEQARTTRDEVADQLSDYVLPRLVQLDAPLLAVVGGSTGAGKSTLVNSIVGDKVTEAGVLRPTTRSPVLVHHPADAEWFSRDRLLPDLPRLGEVAGSAVHGLRLVATDAVPQGLAILDAPDVDSIDVINRELATQLLAAADLWLFVTSAARYADQVPWEYLKRASDRATSLGVVLDRTADDAIPEVRGHLARMMTARGLSDSPLFTIPESGLDGAGLLPEELVTPIAGWLRDLAVNPDMRRDVVGRTLDGAVRHIVLRVHDVADALDDQLAVAATLSTVVDAAFTAADQQIVSQCADGSLLGGEVGVRWQEAVSGGAVARSLDGSASARDRELLQDLEEAMGSAVRTLLLDAADSASEQVTEGWSDLEAGRALLASHPAVDRSSTALRVRVEQEVTGWRRELTSTAGSAGAVVCVLTEALGDPARPGQGRQLLESVLGAEAAERVIDAARTDLRSRADEVLGIDRQRIEALAPSVAAVETAQAALRDAARKAEHARHADFLNGALAP